MILVTGAAGKTGLSVTRSLSAAGAAVRALVHRAEHHSRVEAAGAREIATGDLLDRDAVVRAARGAEAIYHICPNVHAQEVTIGRNAIAAARRGGVRRFVFHSVLHPQIEAMPHHWAKLRVEEELFASGLDTTILQPAPYYQNVTAQLAAVAKDGVYAVPYALTTRVSMVDLEDVATAAAVVLDGERDAGAIYELCAPELLDPRAIAAALEEALGRPVRAERLPDATWEASARGAGMKDTAIATLRAMFRYYETHGMRGGSATLGWLLGRPPTRIAECLERLAGAAA